MKPKLRERRCMGRRRLLVVQQKKLLFGRCFDHRYCWDQLSQRGRSETAALADRGKFCSSSQPFLNEVFVVCCSRSLRKDKVLELLPK